MICPKCGTAIELADNSHNLKSRAYYINQTDKQIYYTGNGETRVCHKPIKDSIPRKSNLNVVDDSYDLVIDE